MPKGVYVRTVHIDRSGSKNGRWKGGIKYLRGYRYLYRPDHPMCDVNGYVFEHRLVMEEFLGRYLWDFEVVHHRNHNKSDNRLENLELFISHAVHISYHHKKR